MTHYLNQALTPETKLWWLLLIFGLIQITVGLYDEEPQLGLVIAGILMLTLLGMTACFYKWAGLLFVHIDPSGIVVRQHYIQKRRTLGWDDIASVELTPTYILIHPQREAPDIIIKAEQDPEDYLRTAIRQQADQNKIPVTHMNG